MTGRQICSLLMWVLLTLPVTGCGGGGGGDQIHAGTPATVSGPSTTTATVVVDTGLASRARTESITQLRFTGRDASGDVRYGPVLFERAPRITLTQVPVTVVAIVMECLDAQGVTTRVFNVPVVLSPGAQVVVSNAYDTSPHLVSLVVTPPSPSIAVATTAQFAARGTFSDGSSQDLTTSVSWSSSATAVATISGSGVASGRAAGTSTVSATVGVISGTAQLTVTSASLQSISLTPSDPVVARGLTQQFRATGTFSDRTTQDITSLVTWASSNESVATISNAAASQGLATVVAESGVTTISATLAGITGQTTLTGSSKVMVSITVEGTATTVAASQSINYTARAAYSDNSTGDVTSSVTWTSASTAVATVSDTAPNQGRVTGVASGATNIRATDPATGVYGTLGVAVTSNLLAATSLPQGTLGQIQVLLNDGTVLIAGGGAGPNVTNLAWTYAPATGLYTPTLSTMAMARRYAAATLLPDGKVLLAGGNNGFVALFSAEVYDPVQRTFAATGDMASDRAYPAGVLLPSGKVMVIGGRNDMGTSLASTEIYDPVARTFSPGRSMLLARSRMAALALADGRVFVAGGYGINNMAATSAEIFTEAPAPGSWTIVQGMSERRELTGTLLQDGRVLLAGGVDLNNTAVATAEVFDPSSGVFAMTGSMTMARNSHGATRLVDGRVYVTGGLDAGAPLSSTDVYDPTTGSFTASLVMTVARSAHGATLLGNGRVLITGGMTTGGAATSSADLFLP